MTTTARVHVMHSIKRTGSTSPGPAPPGESKVDEPAYCAAASSTSEALLTSKYVCVYIHIYIYRHTYTYVKIYLYILIHVRVLLFACMPNRYASCYPAWISILEGEAWAALRLSSRLRSLPCRSRSDGSGSFGGFTLGSYLAKQEKGERERAHDKLACTVKGESAARSEHRHGKLYERKETLTFGIKVLF